MEIEICIPAYNEEKVIISTLKAIKDVCLQTDLYKIKLTVVDNNSTDNTAMVIKNYDPQVNVIHQPIKGKGAAVRLAAQQSTSDYFLYIDADLSAEPKHILELFEALQAGFDIAVGSRLLKSEVVNRSFWRSLTSKMFKEYADLLVPTPVKDTQCGLKLMNQKGTSILAVCEHDGWFFDREFLAKAHKRGLKIKELSVTWEEFRYPNRKSKLKVIRDGLTSLYYLWLIRLSVAKF